MTTFLEHVPPTICENYIDLDCNDSSGATEADYNAQEYTCLSDGVGIADDDIKLLYDAPISSMTIKITGFIPDGTYEILDVTTSVPAINVTGAGTGMITLSNAGGAKSTDFKAALQYVVYKNEAPSPTAGLRTVEVKFTTTSGTMSNIATAFIQVVQLSLVEVDLGPDQLICEEESTTLDAGIPGAVYSWSTGAHSQTITVAESGQYIVTVSDGLNCPGEDTIEVALIPVIQVSLAGDEEICNGEEANLSIDTDTPYPLTVEITPVPGSPFTISNVIGNYEFYDLISFLTEYTITDIIPSQPVCIEMTDSTQSVSVHPTYILNEEASICNGDSIYLGYYWETEAGYYPVLLNSEYGCDSLVNFTITVLPSVNIFIQSTTCDSSEAGVFITYLTNPNGCDTTVQTTITLLTSDTTLINLQSCNVAGTGVTTQTLSNQSGCDSLVITTTSLIPPADTTLLSQMTCDSSLAGVQQQILSDQSGCDSLIITTVTMMPTDITYLTGTSCDTSIIGIVETLFSNQLGCDSLVITQISAGIPDTTSLLATSCDSSSLGVLISHFTNANGCDSTVMTTVSFAAQDSTFLTGTSCDPAAGGIFVSQYTNQFGCDSIVTTTINVLQTDVTATTGTTCDPALAGVFTDTLQNQFGCDSIVTETITVLNSDYVMINGTICISAEAGIFVTTFTNQNGCDSIVTEVITLIPTDTTLVIQNTCDPAQVGSISTLYTGQDGCDSLVIKEKTLYPLPQLELQAASDFNGYEISCDGGSDGAATAIVNGTEPFTYAWSNGSSDVQISGLMAGLYTLTVTDGNGCSVSEEIALQAPGMFMITFEVSEPDCFGQALGSITVMQSGGVQPVLYSIDGVTYQASNSFTSIVGGTYTITAVDANTCETKEIIWINVPLQVHVDLGTDRIVIKGETEMIEALVNVPFDSLASVVWTGLSSPDCPGCLTQPVAPIITTTYSVSVVNHQGCADQDSMTLFIERDIDVYVPNIFSPNGDNINDRLVISSGEDVERIASFTIFDRWGNMVYSANNLLPNDPFYGWDGKRNEVALDPGVFTYRMIAVFRDGRNEVRYGNVTLVR